MTLNATQLVEIRSAHGFTVTVERLTQAFENAGMTIFARVDHQAGALQVGLHMPPTLVLIYGNPKGGTPLMLSAPACALDLPLRVLIREDEAGTAVAFHPAVVLAHTFGLPEANVAGLAKSEALIAAACE